MDFIISTPNGEEPVKVNRQTTVQEIVSELCQKIGLSEDSYHLLYKSKPLDPGLKLFYSGLKDKTLLAISKFDFLQKPITVLLHVDDLRFIGYFEPEESLWTIVTDLCPADCLKEFVQPIVVHYQKEIIGLENIRNTVLKSIWDNEKISLRLTSRNRKLSMEKPKKQYGKARVANSTRKPKPFQPAEQELGEVSKVLDASLELSSLNISFLGERNALIFSTPDTSSSSDDFSEDFFELTSEEVKEVYQGLKRTREDLEEKPLLTRARRLQDEAERLQRMINRYQFTVIRVQFPDLMILQGIFKPLETVQSVLEFVSEYIQEPLASFHLYTTPPKTILQPEKRLIDIHCVPSAKVYFGFKSGSLSEVYLKENLLDQATDYEVANKVAAVFRKSSAPVMNEPPRETQPGVGQSQQQALTEALQAPDPPCTIRKTPSDKVPKWFKR